MRRLRGWWADSPRAQRLPTALAIPGTVAVAGLGLGLLAFTGTGRVAFVALGVAGLGLAIWTTVLVLRGRETL